MATKLQVRRDTAANWISSNPTLAQGEPGLETDTLLGKWGDGATAWNSLPYSWAGTPFTPTNIQTANYTFAKSDLVKRVVMNAAGATTLTVPQDSAVSPATWAANSVLRGSNKGAGTTTITPGAGVTINGSGLAVVTNGAFMLQWEAANTWTFIPFSGGASPAAYSGTTGSPTITTVSGKASAAAAAAISAAALAVKYLS